MHAQHACTHTYAPVFDSIGAVPGPAAATARCSAGRMWWRAPAAQRRLRCRPQACFKGGQGREAGLWDALVSITEATGVTVPGHPQQGGQRRGGGTWGLPPRRGSIVALDS